MSSSLPKVSRGAQRAEQPWLAKMNGCGFWNQINFTVCSIGCAVNSYICSNRRNQNNHFWFRKRVLLPWKHAHERYKTQLSTDVSEMQIVGMIFKKFNSCSKRRWLQLIWLLFAVNKIAISSLAYYWEINNICNFDRWIEKFGDKYGFSTYGILL